MVTVEIVLEGGPKQAANRKKWLRDGVNNLIVTLQNILQDTFKNEESLSNGDVKYQFKLRALRAIAGSHHKKGILIKSSNGSSLTFRAQLGSNASCWTYKLSIPNKCALTVDDIQSAIQAYIDNDKYDIDENANDASDNHLPASSQMTAPSIDIMDAVGALREMAGKYREARELVDEYDGIDIQKDLSEKRARAQALKEELARLEDEIELLEMEGADLEEAKRICNDKTYSLAEEKLRAIEEVLRQ